MYRLSCGNGRYFPDLPEFVEYMNSADAEFSTRDCRKLMALEMRAVDKDSRLKSHLRTRRVGITSYSWNIVPYDKKLTDEVTKVKARLKKAINRILRLYYQVPTYGCFANRLRWDRLPEFDGSWAPAVQKAYSPSDINWDSDAEYLRIWADDGLSTISPYEIASDMTDWIIASDGGSVAGGELRTIMIEQILKNAQLQEWANFNDNLKGLILAQIDSIDSQGDIQEVENALGDLAVRKSAIVSKDTDISFRDLVSSMGGSSFETLIRYIDSGASIGLLGQANTSELPARSGSRAAVQVQKLITADIGFDDMSGCESLINEQLLFWDYIRNKGENKGTPPWEFKFIYQEDSDLEARITAITELRRAGIPILTEEVYSTVGMTRPDGLVDVIGKLADEGVSDYAS